MKKKKCEHDFWFLGVVYMNDDNRDRELREDSHGYERKKKYQCEKCLKIKYKEIHEEDA